VDFYHGLKTRDFEVSQTRPYSCDKGPIAVTGCDKGLIPVTGCDKDPWHEDMKYG